MCESVGAATPTLTKPPVSAGGGSTSVAGANGTQPASSNGATSGLPASATVGGGAGGALDGVQAIMPQLVQALQALADVLGKLVTTLQSTMGGGAPQKLPAQVSTPPAQVSTPAPAPVSTPAPAPKPQVVATPAPPVAHTKPS